MEPRNRPRSNMVAELRTVQLIRIKGGVMKRILIAIFALAFVGETGAFAQEDIPKWSRDPSFSGLRFSDYPATPYRGRWILPNFNGPQKQFRIYRTRLAYAAKQGINFA